MSIEKKDDENFKRKEMVKVKFNFPTAMFTGKETVQKFKDNFKDYGQLTVQNIHMHGIYERGKIYEMEREKAMSFVSQNIRVTNSRFASLPEDMAPIPILPRAMIVSEVA